MRKILVLGGTGFIGAHLCKRLLAEGSQVTALASRPMAGGLIVQMSAHPAFRFVQHDVREPFDIEAEEIYNLAGPASPRDCSIDPARTLTTHVSGAANALVLARKNQAVLLQASSSEIYGVARTAPQREEDWGNVNPVGPRAYYYEAKRSAEALAAQAQRAQSCRVKIARIFNIYGPYCAADDGRVIPGFIVNALQGKALQIHGKGTQLRSYCHVDDLVEALILLMRAPDAVTGPMNLGSPDPISVAALARKICELTGSMSEIQYSQASDNGVSLYPDITLAQSMLGWVPKITLYQGLQSTIDYFRNVSSGGS